jgi:hypothetical protein
LYLIFPIFQDENKSKKRVGSSKSVTFSEPNPDLKVVGKAAGEDSGKESGVESGGDAKMDESGLKINEDAAVGENEVDNIESGIDNGDIDDSFAILESESNNENGEIVDDDGGNVDDADQTEVDINVDETAVDVDGENNVDQTDIISVDGENNAAESSVISFKDEDEDIYENIEEFNSIDDAEGQQMTQEQTASEGNDEKEVVDDDLVNVEDLDRGSELVQPSSDEAGEEVLNDAEGENVDSDGESVPKDETQDVDNSGSAVAADQVVLEDDDPNEMENVQSQDGADGNREQQGDGTATNSDDVDAILKMI